MGVVLTFILYLIYLYTHIYFPIAFNFVIRIVDLD